MAGSTRERVHLWTADGTQARVFPGALAGVSSFSPDSRRLLVFERVQGIDRYDIAPMFLRVVDVETGRDLFTVKDEKGTITAAAWASDDVLLAAQFNGVIRLLNGKTGAAEGELDVLAQAKAKGLDGSPRGPEKNTNAFTGAAGRVVFMAVSPDGKTLAAHHMRSNSDEPFAIWDLGQKRLRHLSRWQVGNNCIQMSIGADNRSLHRAFEATHAQPIELHTADLGDDATLDESLKFYRSYSGQSIEERAAFSPDGAYFAQSAASQHDIDNMNPTTVVHLVDIKTKKRSQLTSLKYGLPALAFSADGKTLAVGAYDGTIQFWNTADASLLPRKQEYHTARLIAVAVSGDERYLATASEDDTVCIREIATGKMIRVLTDKGADDKISIVDGVAFLPDGKTLLARSRDGEHPRDTFCSIRFWDWREGTQMKRIVKVPRHGGPMAVTPDGKYAGFSTGGTIAVIDIEQGKVLEAPHGPFVSGLIRGLRFNVRAKREAAFGDRENYLPSLTAKPMWRGDFERMKWHCAVFTPDGTELLAGHYHRLLILSAATGDEVRRIAPVSEPAARRNVPFIRHVALAPDGKRIVAIQDADATMIGREEHELTSDALIHIFDRTTGGKKATFQGHRGPIVDFAFAEGGRALFTAGADGAIYLWDLDGGPPPGPVPTDPAALAALLTGNDDAPAMQAMQALVADPQAAEQAIAAWWSGATRHAGAEPFIAPLGETDLAKRLDAISALADMGTKEPAVEGMIQRAILAPDAPVTLQLAGRGVIQRFFDPAARDFVTLLRVIKLSEWIGDDAAKSRLALYADRLPVERGGKASRIALDRIARGEHRKEFDALPPLPKPGDAPPPANPLKILDAQ